jgi:hypothetical protein
VKASVIATERVAVKKVVVVAAAAAAAPAAAVAVAASPQTATRGIPE